MRSLYKYLYCIPLLLISVPVVSQEIPLSVKNTGIYAFLDELASTHVVSLNSAVKPYSRLYIAQMLHEADSRRTGLNMRQQKELDFYLKAYADEIKGNDSLTGKADWFMHKDRTRRFDLFHYRDSLFTLTVNPVLGGELFVNSSGNATYWRNGIEAVACVGRFGFYASLRDNHENPLLSSPSYLTKREGGHIKDGTDWSEMRGGITYAWKWGNIGLVKDNFVWGNNYNGANIFGGNNPSYVHFRLNLRPVKWFEFNYIHGWLNSMVVDSSRSYWVSNSYGTDYREVYHKKFIAANMFTFSPFRNFYVSAGNSIVYSDIDLHPAYLIPLFFYKSVDHSVNSGIGNMNSQMFFDISSRQIKDLHLYATLFVDELSVNRIFEKDEWNFFSWKAGFQLSNFPVRNLFLTGEYTYTLPLSFMHNVSTLTFESNEYNLGHWLKDNSRELFMSVSFKPVRTLNIDLFYADAVRGPDYTETGAPRVGNPPLATTEWHDRSFGIRSSYQVINDLYTWISLASGNITGDSRWSSTYFFGRKTTVNFGMTYGF